MGVRSGVPADPRGRCLLVFTKPAVAGRVKTRLIGHLSAPAAAELHRALLDDLLAALAAGRFSIRLLVALERDEAPPRPPPGVARVVPQRGIDLGERLFHALSEAAREHRQIAVVGSDLPGLDRCRVEQAFGRLDAGDDVVLGPTVDGGYYLLAIRADRLDPRLFTGIAWSTERVLEQTVARCDALALRRFTLETERDLDRPEDLDWLARALRAGVVDSPRVLEWLERQHPAPAVANPLA